MNVRETQPMICRVEQVSRVYRIRVAGPLGDILTTTVDTLEQATEMVELLSDWVLLEDEAKQWLRLSQETWVR
jgi:hypothetical protein